MGPSPSSYRPRRHQHHPRHLRRLRHVRHRYLLVDCFLLLLNCLLSLLVDINVGCLIGGDDEDDDDDDDDDNDDDDDAYDAH